jgi:hypothetical protein
MPPTSTAHGSCTTLLTPTSTLDILSPTPPHLHKPGICVALPPPPLFLINENPLPTLYGPFYFYFLTIVLYI